MSLKLCPQAYLEMENLRQRFRSRPLQTLLQVVEPKDFILFHILFVVAFQILSYFVLFLWNLFAKYFFFVAKMFLA